MTAPSMALMVAAFGGTGVLAGVAAFVMLLVGSEAAPTDQLGPMIVMFAFFGITSLAMSIAGGMAVRSGLIVVRLESGTLRWRKGTEAGSIASEGARIVVRQQGFGTYRYYSVQLLGTQGEPLELGGSVLESLARARCRWFARSLKLELPSG